MTANELAARFDLLFDSLYELAAPAYSDSQKSQLLTLANRRVFFDAYYPMASKYRKGFEMDEANIRSLEQYLKTANISGTGSTGSITYTGNTTLSSRTITNMSSIVGLTPGIAITGAGIPASTTITSILSSTSIYISAAATATATGVTLTSGIGKSEEQGQVHTNGVVVNLPSDFLYAVEESGRLLAATSDIMVKPVTHNFYNTNYKNPYKKPSSELIWRMNINKVTPQSGTTASSSARTELITDGTALTYYKVTYLINPPDIVVDTTTTTNQRHSYLNDILQEKVVTMAVRIATGAVKPEEYQIKSLEVLDSE